MKESRHSHINEKKWDKWAEVSDGKGFKYEYLRKAQGFVIDLADIKENINFLDIGCGTGWAVGLAAKAAKNTGNFYGIDLSEAMIKKAAENFKGIENIRFIKSNSESIPLPDSYFDTIICTNSFHHYLHPDKAISEISRLLSPGGKAYILDPAADHLIIKIVNLLYKIFDRAHVKIYSSREFEKLFVKSGLKYCEPKPLNKYHIVQIGQKHCTTCHDEKL